MVLNTVMLSVFYAEYPKNKTIALSIIMLSVVMVNVIMESVMAPLKIWVQIRAIAKFSFWHLNTKKCAFL